MSIEDAKAAIEKMKSDKAFCDEVNAKESPKEKLAVCRKAGYEFTLEDLEQLAKETGGENSPIEPFCTVSNAYTICCDGIFR